MGSTPLHSTFRSVWFLWINIFFGGMNGVVSVSVWRFVFYLLVKSITITKKVTTKHVLTCARKSHKIMCTNLSHSLIIWERGSLENFKLYKILWHLPIWIRSLFETVYQIICKTTILSYRVIITVDTSVLVIFYRTSFTWPLEGHP